MNSPYGLPPLHPIVQREWTQYEEANERSRVDYYFRTDQLTEYTDQSGRVRKTKQVR